MSLMDCSNRFGRIHVIDSHTGGEPTRVVVEGGPALGDGPLSHRLRRFREDFDHLRSAIVNEPRGSDPLVGALLCEPNEDSCSAGVIFFNNVGFLGMCGHGTIGLAVTLSHLGLINQGRHRIDTPVGVVEAELHESGQVTVRNVASFRHANAVRLRVEGFGEITGDVAWGGNWFFLTEDCPFSLEFSNVEALSGYARAVRLALTRDGVRGTGGEEIDHIEISGPPRSPDADSRNFVLCPGGSYDRSPCGTGTSAKLACLWADGKLGENQTWRQESLIGSLFEGSITVRDNRVYPNIKGSAFIVADAWLLLDSRDPFKHGINA